MTKTLAYLRDAHQFHNALLVERANGNYADTMARQFLFDVWHYFLLQKLERSADERVAAIAAKALKEVTYHVRRSSDMVVRLGDGTAESHAKMQAAIDDAWRFTGELFFDDAVDQDLPRAASAVCCPSCASPGPATWPRCWARPRCPCRTPQPPAIPPIAAAARAGIARNWATCWPRCNSCRAPIREPSGERHAARVRRPGLRLAAGSAGSGDPVLSVVDLGVVRDVRWDGETCVVVITPTYSGCPAMREITQDIAATLARHGVDDARVETRLAPAWTTDWMSEKGRAAQGYGIAAPPSAPSISPASAAAARARHRVPALRLARHAPGQRFRLHVVQGAVPLRRLPRALRLFQDPLSG